MRELAKGERRDREAAPLRPAPSAVYRALFDNPDLALYVVAVLPDGSFRFDDANAPVAAFLSRPTDPIVGRAPAECLIPEVAECLEANLRHCLTTGQVHSYDTAMDLPQGRMSWTTALTPIANRRGRIGHVVGVTRDITYEQRLLTAVGQRRSIMEGIDATAPGLIYLFDLKARSSRYVGGSSPLGYEADEFRRMGSRLVSEQIHPDDLPGVEKHFLRLSTLRDGEVAPLEYRIRHKQGHYVHLLSRDTVFSRDAHGETELILGIAVDITDRKGMEREVRLLSEQLVTTRSDERRRIAQDLHDSTGQHLVAAELALARVQAGNAEWVGEGVPGAIGQALTDVMAEIKEAEREIRILTFLLHPPSVESQGLAEATRSLALGFGSRAALALEVRVDPQVDELPEHVAVSIFRICQEALTNVHRHARAKRVIVALQLLESSVALTVTDDGVGFDEAGGAAASGIGVGLAGMRERMEQLGGSLELYGNGGMKVVATAPRLSTRTDEG